ncbi:MAG: four helix bundle protein [Pirellulales bacterium]
MRTYRELKFWDRTHKFVVRVHEVTRSFPKEELVNLTSLIRRTATTIGSHLVEGANSSVERESSIPLQSAIAATSQLEYQILLAHDLGYLDATTYEELTTEVYEVRRMMAAHLVRIRSLR